MYPSKIPGIAAELERRIRRGIYGEKLPPVHVLQSQFCVAKQTVTESIRLLSKRGLVKSRATRCGVDIFRENLQNGKILIVTREESPSYLEKLNKEIKLDGLIPCPVPLTKLTNFSPYLQKDIYGVIFIHSTLTVEWAEILMQAGIPFISCNQLFSSPKVDTFDYDLEHDLNWIVQSMVSRGYRRIGLFYSGSLEGFNDYFWKRFRQIKRRYGLPCESSDDIAVKWNDSHYDRLKHTFTEMQRRKSYPEAMISFFDLRSILPDVIAESKIQLPEKFLFLIFRSYSVPNLKPEHGIYTFYMKPVISNLWIAAYNRLREMIFSPTPLSPKIQLICRDLYLDHELPLI